MLGEVAHESGDAATRITGTVAGLIERGEERGEGAEWGDTTAPSLGHARQGGTASGDAGGASGTAHITPATTKRHPDRITN